MAGGFSFPPPPPPPPKPASTQDQGYSQYESQQSGRGGRGRGTFEPRGRGQSYGRGGQNFRGRGNANMTPLNSNGNGRGGGQRSYGNNDSNPSAHQQTPDSMPYSRSGSGFPPGAHVNPNFAGQSREPTNTLFSYGSESKPNHGLSNYHQDSRAKYHQTQPRSFEPSAGLSRTAAGHKRKLEALRGPQEPQDMKPDAPVVPSVPNFGAPILPAPRQGSYGKRASLPQATGTKPAGRSLGLTPRDDDVEPDEVSDSGGEDQDVDEEAQFAELGTKLTFEHNGEVLSLNNEADLTMWKEERRKKWPTSNRVAQREDDRRKIGAERKRLLAAAALIQRPPREKDPKPSDRNKRQEQLSTDIRKLPVGQPTDGGDRQEDASQKARTRVEEPTVQVVASSTMNDQMPLGEPNAQPPMAHQDTTLPPQALFSTRDTGGVTRSKPLGLPGINMDDTDEEDSPADDVHLEPPPTLPSNESSSSDSDDDGPPDESSTKQPEPSSSHSRKPVCRYFAASGSCRDGDTCRFRHELSSRAPVTTNRINVQTPKQPYDRFAPKLDQPVNGTRKSIHERLVEQEQLEEDRLTLQAIKALGVIGFLNASGAGMQ